MYTKCGAEHQKAGICGRCFHEPGKNRGKDLSKKGRDLRKIAKAVVNAGFSVRFVWLAISFSDITIESNGSFIYQGQPYQWLQFQNSPAKGELILKLVDEGFLPRKESALWKKKIESSNSRTDQKTFHVVLEQ